jgi:hypothetical protein
MRRITITTLITFAVLVMFPAAVFASDGLKPVSNVTITVVMPDTEPTADRKTEETNPTVTPAPTKPLAFTVYPARVEEKRENGGRQIIKTYELDARENPNNIPREGFIRDGWEYELADITKSETATADAAEHTETVELNTDTKDMEAIIQQLQPQIEYTSEDGYAGFLSLNIASIKVEQAGTKTNSYTLTAKREYPHLSSNDTSLIPKTIEDGGKTYTLAGVDWKAGNTVTVDYEAMPEYYTAYANYTATGSKTVVTGYITTAEYVGTISKIGQGKTVYTACFLGKEIVPERIPLEIVELGETLSKPEATGENGVTAELPDGAEPSSTTEAEVKSESSNEPEPTDSAATGTVLETDGTNWPVVIIFAVLCALLIGGGFGYFVGTPSKTPKGKEE